MTNDKTPTTRIRHERIINILDHIRNAAGLLAGITVAVAILVVPTHHDLTAGFIAIGLLIIGYTAAPVIAAHLIDKPRSHPVNESTRDAS